MAKEAVRLAYLGISRLVLTYFLSQNTIHSTSRALFILPAEHPQNLAGCVWIHRLNEIFVHPTLSFYLLLMLCGSG
jgi:hypothetical protein